MLQKPCLTFCKLQDMLNYSIFKSAMSTLSKPPPWKRQVWCDCPAFYFGSFYLDHLGSTPHGCITEGGALSAIFGKLCYQLPPLPPPPSAPSLPSLWLNRLSSLPSATGMLDSWWELLSRSGIHQKIQTNRWTAIDTEWTPGTKRNILLIEISVGKNTGYSHLSFYNTMQNAKIQKWIIRAINIQSWHRVK